MSLHTEYSAFEQPGPLSERKPLECCGIAQLTRHGKWRVENLHAHDRHVLMWFTRGQGRIMISGVRRGFGPNNAVFLPAGTPHSIDLTQQVHGTAVFIPRGHDLGFPKRPLHLRIRDVHLQGEIQGILERLQRESEDKQPSADRAALHYAGLLGVWLERNTIPSHLDAPESSAATRLVVKFCEELENGFKGSHSVGHYASRLGVTATHLSRVCNSVSGIPASNMLNERVTHEALRLLTETNSPIKSIAADLGFSSPAYFTRVITSQTGQSPRAFRTAHKTDPA